MTEFLAERTSWLLTNGLRLAGIILLAIVLNRLLRMLANRLVPAAGEAGTQTRVALMREQQRRTVAGILYSAGTAVIVLLAVLMALDLVGLNIAPVAAAAGLASLALGLGAQHLIRDFLNGFFIVFEDQFVVGDTVRIGEAAGRVEHFTLRRTVLRDLQGALVVIPNGEIRQVANLSRDWSQMFVDIALPADADADRALAVLEGLCGEFRRDDTWAAALVEGPRVLGVEAVTLAGITLRLQVRTAPNRQHDVARELRRRILARLERERIALAAVQQVQLVGAGGQPG